MSSSLLPCRFARAPFPSLPIVGHWDVIVNLLAGSLIGAWLGAGWATRLKSETLYKVIAVLLVLIALVLFVGHDAGGTVAPGFQRPERFRLRLGSCEVL